MKKSEKLSSDGFTLIECMVAMFCLSITGILVLGCINIISILSKDDYHNEDHIAIMQLRTLMAQSIHYRMENQILYFQYQGEENRLEFHNRRLVRRSGYEIFLKDIDAVDFYIKGGCYYASWQREQKDRQAVLMCE